MYLVELEGVQQIEQLAVLLGLGQFDIVLLVFVKRWLKVRGRYLETVKGQLGLIINENFEWLKAECR